MFNQEFYNEMNQRINEWFQINKHHFGSLELNMDAVTSIAIMVTEYGIPLTGTQMVLMHGTLKDLWVSHRLIDEAKEFIEACRKDHDDNGSNRVPMMVPEKFKNEPR